MNIERWFNKEARWYEFWYPDSGIVGGFIFGLIFSHVVFWSIYGVWVIFNA